MDYNLILRQSFQGFPKDSKYTEPGTHTTYNLRSSVGKGTYVAFGFRAFDAGIWSLGLRLHPKPFNTQTPDQQFEALNPQPELLDPAYSLQCSSFFAAIIGSEIQNWLNQKKSRSVCRRAGCVVYFWEHFWSKARKPRLLCGFREQDDVSGSFLNSFLLFFGEVFAEVSQIACFSSLVFVDF